MVPTYPLWHSHGTIVDDCAINDRRRNPPLTPCRKESDRPCDVVIIDNPSSYKVKGVTEAKAELLYGYSLHNH